MKKTLPSFRMPNMTSSMTSCALSKRKRVIRSKTAPRTESAARRKANLSNRRTFCAFTALTSANPKKSLPSGATALSRRWDIFQNSLASTNLTGLRSTFCTTTASLSKPQRAATERWARSSPIRSAPYDICPKPLRTRVKSRFKAKAYCV